MIEVRPTEPHERRTAAATFSAALLQSAPTDEKWEQSVPSWDDMDSISAWDDDRCVGHVGGFRFDTVIPGGARLATSGVTRVGVLTTHRRRGLLSSMMTTLLSDARRDGKVLASLRASEAVIYGRFGFGVAGEATEIVFRPAEARPIRNVGAGSIRLLDSKEILDVVPPIYDRAAVRPGIITRPAWMWARYFRDAIEGGDTASFVAVHTGGDGDDGFVHYDTKWRTSPGTYPTGEGEVYDLVGQSPSAELALWSYLADVDLIESWNAEERPVDDLIRHAAADPRCYRTRMRYDEQWVRLLDVDRALAARTYADAGRPVTIAVEDPMFPDNTGVWRIAADGARRIDDAAASGHAELVASIVDASAAYLGGTPWQALVASGRVVEHRRGAAVDADALYAVHPAPFSGSHF